MCICTSTGLHKLRAEGWGYLVEGHGFILTCSDGHSYHRGFLGVLQRNGTNFLV